MDSEMQFEEFCIPSTKNSKNNLTIDEQMDLFLGISPFQNTYPSEIIYDNSFVEEEPKTQRKSSFKTDSYQTDHRSDSNLSSQVINSKKSNHHNFQKHTTTALKDMVKELQFESQCEDTSSLTVASALWTQFKSIKGKSIMTKKFLSTFLSSDVESVLNLKQYGFKAAFELYTQNQIRNGKNELRKLVIKFLSNKSIQQHVQKRQIKRKQQFRLYLINFRQELQNIKIKKRISKQSSQWINNNAEIFDCVI